jgi:acyl-CoA synthetase (NDP forming)
MPEFSSDLQAKLRGFLRPEASVGNPIDLIASIDPTEFQRSLELVFTSGEVDAVITIYVARELGTSPAVARAIREVTETLGRETTSLAVFLQLGEMPAELHDKQISVPNFLHPEAAAGALARAVEYAERRTRPRGEVREFSDIRAEDCRSIVIGALQRLGTAGGWLNPDEVQAMLRATGLSLPRCQLVDTADSAAILAREWQCPVVLKVVSPTVLHKTDVGGVIVNVRGETAVREAFRQVMQAASDAQGAIVQEFIAGGHEALIGLTRDAQFGHLVTFGLGGVLVELLNDVACRLHPLTDRDADEMLSSLRTSPILIGYRNRPGADIPALRETLLRVSQLATIVPEIAEMDLNPVLALPPPLGVRVVDARIRIVPSHC